MSTRKGSPGVLVFIVLAVGSITAQAADVLVADRLTNSVWRYSDGGVLLNRVVQDATNLPFQGGGLALSPSGTHLYVSNRVPAQIVRYDFDGTSATNPVVVPSTGGYPLADLAGLTFSSDGNTLYAGGTGGVAQFNKDTNLIDGDQALVPAGPKLSTGAGPDADSTAVGLSAAGDLLALTTMTNAVRYNGSSFVSFSPFIGLGAMTVHDNDLYVVGAFFPTLRKADATTGTPDITFGTGGTVNTDPAADGSGAFPASIVVGPDDDNSLLIGILTNDNGEGHIARYSLTGTNLGIWADHGVGANDGFHEATGMLVVPEPSCLLICGATATMLMMRSRKRRTT